MAAGLAAKGWQRAYVLKVDANPSSNPNPSPHPQPNPDPNPSPSPHPNPSPNPHPHPHPNPNPNPMLKVDARSLAGLCEDIGTPAQNEQFNTVRLGLG